MFQKVLQYFFLLLLLSSFIFLELSSASSFSENDDNFINSNTTILKNESLTYKDITEVKNVWRKLKSSKELQLEENSQKVPYLRQELEDVKKIRTTLKKLGGKIEISEIEDLQVSTKTQSGKDSIFVQALQSIIFQRRSQSEIRGLSFNLQDSKTGKFIRPAAMLSAHVASSEKVFGLPRIITKVDRVIKIKKKEFRPLFLKHYEDVFGYDLAVETGIPKSAKKLKAVKIAEEKLYKKYRDVSKMQLKNQLFENPFAIKSQTCRYRDNPGFVTIYYDILSDLFAVVDEKTNKLLDFSIASEIDYRDVFRYKCVFREISKEMEEVKLSCPTIEWNPFEQSLCLENLIRKDSETDSTFEQTERRRLLAVNPNPVPGGKLDQKPPVFEVLDPNPAPGPTGKLDQRMFQVFDFTTKEIPPFQYRSREGFSLSADNRSLQKIIYGHAPELELTDLINRIPCPVQPSPDKYQRVTCWAITDKNMEAALIKLITVTSSSDPNILTVEMPWHEKPNSTTRATYYIDRTTGVAFYFHKGDKRDGKLWSVVTFDLDELTSMLEQPDVQIITDLNINIPTRMKKQLDKNAEDEL